MKSVFSILLLLLSTQLSAKDLFSFTVSFDETYVDVPVSIPLDQINYHCDSLKLHLYEVSQLGEGLIPCQIERGHSTRLWFLIKGVSSKKSVRKYVVRLEETTLSEQSNSLIYPEKADGNLTFFSGNHPIICYRYETMFPPTGIDPLFKRSGFIHPLWSPKGEVLTRVQAPDHYHHYGIWGPWTMTHIGEREVDFWNLNKGEGTVTFAGFASETSGNVYSGFKALQQHIDYGAKGEDQIVINEILDVRVWNSGTGYWIIDYTTAINTPLKEGVMLDAYRYGGGIGYRATEKWTKHNSSVLTSEGKDRKEADGSNARWCIVEGESDVEEGRSGILFLSHPLNREHPEPVRVWPEDANGNRGDLFFEFSPIRHKSWELKRGEDYVLKYRMIVFDGQIDKEAAEAYWRSFAVTPRIEIKRNK